MDEYLVVTFDDDRGVIINAAPTEWATNEVIPLQAGTYIITLAPPPNFTPREIKVVLRNTTVLTPKQITFTKVPS